MIADELFHPQERPRNLPAHLDWAARFAGKVTPIESHANDRNTNRKLRIGYLSGDFKSHSVAYFLEPILEHHDRTQFEITAYSNTEKSDKVTQRLKSHCDRWRDVLWIRDDDALAPPSSPIVDDQIDVLIELSGHTLGNRLMVVLARKPAGCR